MTSVSDSAPTLPEGKAARKGRAAAARPGTVAANPRIAIEDTPSPDSKVRPLEAHLNARRVSRRVLDEYLSTCPIIVRVTAQGRRVQVWRTPDGSWWRRGGGVRVQRWPEKDAGHAIVITLYKGATERDAEWLLQMAEGARRGEGLDRLWEPITADWADEMTFMLAFNSRPCGDPYTQRDNSPRVVVCADDACSGRWHPAEYGYHELDRAVRDLGDRGGYDIRVTRRLDEASWTVDVYTTEFYGAPDDISAFVNDLQWMQEECRRANERAA